ncbi:MAG: cupin domain-containing protein [Geothrix sp.]|nr:cupin domain-containing protein [Geothrix sp.]
MTLLIPTCERVTTLLTAYEEGALGLLDWLGLKLHLALCPPCQTFLGAFERTPARLRQVLDDAPTALAELALASALAALREGRAPRGPQHHPEPEAWHALAPGGDPLTALLLRIHLGHCPACREIQGSDQALDLAAGPLPDSLKAMLPPEAQWRWSRKGPGGGRVAKLVEDAATGASLSLACLPGGRSTPFHDHEGRECALILSGALQDGPAHLRAGDWITHGPGHQHGPTADPGAECWALVALEKPVRFTGWRALF